MRLDIALISVRIHDMLSCQATSHSPQWGTLDIKETNPLLAHLPRYSCPLGE